MSAEIMNHAIEGGVRGTGPRVLVVNQSHPELNYLAAGLATAGCLGAYVRPYANLHRPWERTLAVLPGVRHYYQRTFGRRELPSALPPELVRQSALFDDIAHALSHRLAETGWPAMRRVEDYFMYRRAANVSRVGGRLAAEADVVVANYTAAFECFSVAQGSSTRRVLNYPIAHHRFAQRLLKEEAGLRPEFAATLNNYEWPEAVVSRWDAECAMADLILVGSEFARQSFIEEGFPADKVVAAPYGVDTSRFTRLPGVRGDDGEFRLLFVGQIGQRKGISYLLEAYEHFRRPDTRLTLVGSFVGNPAVFHPYRTLFEHIPHVPRSVLPELYGQADVFVFPTLLEGLGLVVIEAMAMGLPVIVTPNGPGDIVRDGIDGFVVPPRDSHAIVERLEYLRQNDSVRRRMGENARQRALQFTWDAYMQRSVKAVLDVGRQ